jgi:hypothetical protein
MQSTNPARGPATRRGFHLPVTVSNYLGLPQRRQDIVRRNVMPAVEGAPFLQRPSGRPVDIVNVAGPSVRSLLSHVDAHYDSQIYVLLDAGQSS